MVTSDLPVDLYALSDRVAANDYWRARVAEALEGRHSIAFQLAVFSEPFLSLVLSGQKQLESRFAKTRVAPFDSVRAGDIILLKEVAGPIRGLALCRKAWFRDLSHEPLDAIRARYGTDIHAGDEFWSSRRDAAFATLIELASPLAIEPLACEKRDRRGWVTLQSPQLELVF